MSVLLIPVPAAKMLTAQTVAVLLIVLVNRDSLAMEQLAMVSDSFGSLYWLSYYNVSRVATNPFVTFLQFSEHHLSHA